MIERTVVRHGSAGMTRWEAVSEEVGVSRRAFINRSLIGIVGLSIAGIGTASLAFLWPTGSSGFGGKIVAGKISDIVSYIQSHTAPSTFLRHGAMSSSTPRAISPQPRRCTAR